MCSLCYEAITGDEKAHDVAPSESCWGGGAASGGRRKRKQQDQLEEVARRGEEGPAQAMSINSVEYTRGQSGHADRASPQKNLRPAWPWWLLELGWVLSAEAAVV